MKKIIIGFILGSIFFCGIGYAYRIQKPFRITDFDQKNLVILNEALENIWDITNGRYSLDITTSNPDGSIKGTAGDVILLNSTGTYYLEINVGSSVWRGVQLSDTP